MYFVKTIKGEGVMCALLQLHAGDAGHGSLADQRDIVTGGLADDCAFVH